MSRGDTRPGSPAPGFTHRDLFALVVVFTLMFALGAPALSQFGFDRGRRLACLGFLKELGLAAHKYESATKRLPLATSSPGDLTSVAPGSAPGEDAAGAGYGFLVHMLPYVDEDIAHAMVKRDSKGFKKLPFEPDMLALDDQYIGHFVMFNLRCPTVGRAQVDHEFAIGGEGERRLAKTEYADIKLEKTLAMSNYNAMVGTHWDADRGVIENGVLTSRCAIRKDDECVAQGTRIAEVVDGATNTIMIVESLEESYAAWIDGQSSWVVGIDSSKEIAGVGTKTPTAAATMLNIGPDKKTLSPNYSDLALGGGKGWPGRAPRRWGPSSGHSRGMVNHLFVDGHTKAISPEIDPTVYYQLITRNALEAIDKEE